VRLRNGRAFASEPGQTILNAALSGGIALEYSCRNGRCGVCKTRVLDGETRATQPEVALSPADVERGLVLTCCRAAVSDLQLDAEDLARLATVTARTWPARISAIEHLTDDIVTVLLRLPPTANFAFIPGQYIDVMHDGLRRSYSLAAAHREDRLLELHIRRFESGAMSAYWFGKAAANDLVRIEGPLGSFCLREREVDTLYFLATGTGIAPVKALLEDIISSDEHRAKRIKVLWGNRHASDFYWNPRSLPIALDYTPVLSGASDSWEGARGHVQHVMLSEGPDLARASVYACGSQAMIDEASALLAERGLPEANFHYDAFVQSGL
jgi:CDP-4-dehydro-6-deoxyglucose reductase